MKKGIILTVCTAILCAVVGFGQATGSQRQATSSAATSTSAQRALIDQYCVTCHNEKVKAAGLMLDKMDLARIAPEAEAWEKVVRKLRAGMMPPAGARRPDPAASEALTVWLETELDRNAAPNLQALGLHRLNRKEYSNAIRDLLSLDFDATTVLPADDSNYGFDNMASSLGMSPALLEAYVAAAGKISRLAVGHATTTGESTYVAVGDFTQDGHIDGLPFGTRGGLLVKHYFPADGEYVIKLTPMRDNGGDIVGNYVTGEQLEVRVDGERVGLFDWTNSVGDGRADFEFTKNDMRVRIPVKAGLRSVGSSFIATNYAPNDDFDRPFLRSTLETGKVDGFTKYPNLASITVTGPFNGVVAEDTPSRRQVFICRPASAKDELPCAEKIISSLAKRTFRRPATTEDLEGFMEFYQVGRAKGGFEDGIEMALRRILASPQFIFRIEAEPANLKAGQTFRISDLELASRLSFFLWSSAPDDQLINLANQGKLKDAKVLEQQVQRMLADPRSHDLATNFGGQWLYLRNLSQASPLSDLFPDFDDNLRQAFRTETEMFFESVMREDRSILDLLTADYSFVNERLARHYGIPNIYGSKFRRVTFPADNPRRGLGLLGHGSLLTVTALSNRNSPVQRGKWILMNLLGTIPPDPPPNVPALEKTDAAKAGKVLSLREQMEEHRTNPACASCHKIMDPIGFALENFDATGHWRTEDAKTPINAASELVDGTKIDGPVSLQKALLRYSPQYVRTVTEKLLTYALGRGVDYRDMPVVRSIVQEAGRNNNRFSSIVLGIVKSVPFQMQMKSQQTSLREQ